MTEFSGCGFRGWVFFDAACGLCVALAGRVAGPLGRRGFRLVALQAPGVARLLGVPEAELLREMRVLTADGRVRGGADGALELMRHFGWARILVACLSSPAVMPLTRWGYRRIAANRHCADRGCRAVSGITMPLAIDLWAHLRTAPRFIQTLVRVYYLFLGLVIAFLYLVVVVYELVIGRT